MVDMEKLIEEVRMFPVLYDQSNEKYRNSEYKEKVWKIIATNLKVQGGVEECKRKWSSVRDQLRRTLQKRKTTSGQSVFKMRKYKYEDILTFLVPHLGDREGLCNVPKSQDDEEDDEHESDDDNQENFIEETHQQQPTTEDKSILDTSKDNGFQSTTPSSSSVSRNKNKFAAQKTMKQKIPRPEETSQDSPSCQLMAYILADKKASQQDPVDAFLSGIAPSLKSLDPYLLNEAKGRIFSVIQEMEMKQLNSEDYFTMLNNLTFSSPSSESSSPTP